MRCAHARAVPVTSAVTGEMLAALCPDCDVQLPAEFLGCEHEHVIDTPGLGERPGRGICNDCGTDGWYGRQRRDPRAAITAHLVAAGWDPDSVHRAMTGKDFTHLVHTAADASPPTAAEIDFPAVMAVGGS